MKKWLIQNNGAVNTHLLTKFEKTLALKYNLRRTHEALT